MKGTSGMPGTGSDDGSVALSPTVGTAIPAAISGFGDPQCRCGNRGCLESLVGGWALARDLRGHGQGDGHDARDDIDRVKRGDSAAVGALRTAGRVLASGRRLRHQPAQPGHRRPRRHPQQLRRPPHGGRPGGRPPARAAAGHPAVADRPDAVPLPGRHRGRGLVRDHILRPATPDAALARGRSPSRPDPPRGAAPQDASAPPGGGRSRVIWSILRTRPSGANRTKA